MWEIFVQVSLSLYIIEIVARFRTTKATKTITMEQEREKSACIIDMNESYVFIKKTRIKKMITLRNKKSLRLRCQLRLSSILHTVYDHIPHLLTTMVVMLLCKYIIWQTIV